MIHYHGTPIVPREALLALAGRHFCVSYAEPKQARICHDLGQSVMLDNGAYSYWRDPKRPPIVWRRWAEWVEPWLDFHTTWCVLPDSITGGAEENDRLLAEWRSIGGVPVWHLDEPIARLQSLCDDFPRVAFGSSGVYAVVGSLPWHIRVTEAFNAIADSDGRVPWIHMLRGMSLSGTHYPFSSVDSTDIARNHNRPYNTAAKMVARWDAMQNPARWVRVEQLELVCEKAG